MEKYRKIKIVGKGSFGFAVLVENKKTNKQSIMKIIDISKMNQKEIEESLMEVQLLKMVRHPYIVTYRESFMEKMCLCIVMDYCEGGDMFNKIARQKELGILFSEQQIITWLVQMALAMCHVHDKKILHRDLKTQNIFLTSKGDIKIGDFGIARVLQHTYDCANTAIGTPYYLSPEICQEKPYNQKSDIWSLGCIFYEIATLNHAFDAQSMKGLVQKILKGTYPPLPEVYSSDLKKLLSQMLIKDPNKRPSIRKILDMPFMKAKINELMSNTVKIQELKNQKENATYRNQLVGQVPKGSHSNDIIKGSIEVSKGGSTQAPRGIAQTSKGASTQMSKRSKQKPLAKKREQASREKKIDLVSKNGSGLGFKKKNEAAQVILKAQSKVTAEHKSVAMVVGGHTADTRSSVESAQIGGMSNYSVSVKQGQKDHNNNNHYYPSRGAESEVMTPKLPPTTISTIHIQPQSTTHSNNSIINLNGCPVSQTNSSSHVSQHGYSQNGYSQNYHRGNVPATNVSYNVRKPLKEDNGNQAGTSRAHTSKERSALNSVSSSNQSVSSSHKESLTNSQKQSHQHNHRVSLCDDEESLEDQGYGVLLQDMKRCISKPTPNGTNINSTNQDVESNDQQTQNPHSHTLNLNNQVAPKYLKLERIPGVNERDTLGSKIQALRAYLEEQIGDRFFEIYRIVQEEKDQNYQAVTTMLGIQKTKFIPLIVQLIVCEDSYYC